MFKSRQKKDDEVLLKQKRVKEGYFFFDRISLYTKNKEQGNSFQIIDDRTLKDLDFEELFTAIDRTSSAIGQQYLYNQLRCIKNGNDSNQQLEESIQFINNHPQKNEAILALSKLKRAGAYFLQQLFLKEQIQRPSWFWLIPLSALSTLLCIVLTFLNGSFIIPTLILLSINTGINLWNKNNLMSYGNTIPLLLSLYKISIQLNKKAVFSEDEEVKNAIQELKGIKRYALFFKWDTDSLNEIAQLAILTLELLKSAFLLEPIMLFAMIRRIENKKEHIQTLYKAVAKLDTAISISTWRESLPYYSLPNFSPSPEKMLNAEGIYHPLIQDAQENNLKIDDKSILISGSNMSGKSTFIRTIGVNVLLAQALNTCCAKSITLTRFKIFSAIHIQDDLMDNTSYYYQEVKTMKALSEEAENSQDQLFLLDELFKGTNTVERIATGKAVLSYLNNKRNLVFCATHDFELIDLLTNEYDSYFFEEHVKENELFFDYQIRKGRLQNTNAIRILEINNFPKAITNEARAIVAGSGEAN